MLFNSIDFAIFLPIVAVLYWTVFNKLSVKVRNLYLLFCSYFFYGMWDWRFLCLIVLSCSVDFTLGLLIGKTDDNNRTRRKLLLVLSLVVNLGILGFFKYANFFIDSLTGAFTLFGGELSVSSLDIILPVGISFYTFQSLSYIIDIYNRKIEPTKDAVAFFAFISFFPQLVAGPIERAGNLLPQFNTLKVFDYNKAREGLVEIFIGLFKKMIIADRLAVYVDSVFFNTTAGEGSAVLGLPDGGSMDVMGFPSLLGLIFFAFQLYIDFSAYSQIAIGTAKLLGFDLSTNFRRPYLSSSFKVFWERWHITLSQWMRDYIYIPLGGSREGRYRTVRNLIIVFAVSGLWHGASWNFVVWGVMNALFLILLDPLLVKMKVNRWLSSLLVVFMWTLSLSFFRAQGFDTAIAVLGNIGFGNIDKITEYGLGLSEMRFSAIMIALLLLFESIVERMETRGTNYLDVLLFKRPWPIRWSIYMVIVLSIILLGVYATNNDNSFIYFQF